MSDQLHLESADHQESIDVDVVRDEGIIQLSVHDNYTGETPAKVRLNRTQCLQLGGFLTTRAQELR